MRWVVGDIQGCARELDDLVRAIDFDAGRDQLWAVGDIINRGPDSLAAARLWRDLGGRGVIGNHEVYALCSRSGAWPRKPDTLDALRDAPDADVLFARLAGLPALIRLPADENARDVWLVHAGLDPRWTDLDAVAQALESAPHDDTWFERPDVKVCTRMRCCEPGGAMVRFDGKPEERPPGCEPWDALYRGASRVVHGHWAWRGHYRNDAQGVIGLDSGCVYGGSLTAWCMEEDRVVQVPARAQ